MAEPTLAVFAKDLRCEARSRHAITSVLLFALVSAFAVAATLGPCGLKPEVAAGLLWIVIYFSAMSGLSRAFVREEEGKTAALLKLAAPPNAVFLGKLAFNLVLLVAMEVLVTPIILGLTSGVRDWPGLIAILGLGSLALSAGGTMAAAMVARATVKGALYAVISFPLLAPVLFAAVHGTDLALSGSGSPASDIRLLFYYSASVIIASLILFRFVWED